MTYEFRTETVYSIVGQIIHASKQCNRSIHPRGLKSRMYFKLYDINGSLIAEYSSSLEEWKKSIARNMYRLKRGSIESICRYNRY